MGFVGIAGIVSLLAVLSSGCLSAGDYADRHIADVTEVWGVWDEVPFREPADSEEGRAVARGMLEMVYGVANVQRGGADMRVLHEAPPDFVVLELRPGTGLDLPNDARGRTWEDVANVTYRANDPGTLYTCRSDNRLPDGSFLCSDWGTRSDPTVLEDAFGRPGWDA